MPSRPRRRPASTAHTDSAPALRPAVPSRFVALAALDAALSGLGAREARRVTKPLLMPLLARRFDAATRGSRLPARRATLAAQLLSGAGDVALLGRGDRAFLVGLGSFLGAHVAYTAGFATLRDRGAQGARDRGARDRGAQDRGAQDRTARDRDAHSRGPARGPWLAAAGFATAGPLLGHAAGRASARLRAPVVAYAAVLCAMVGAATQVAGPPSARRRTTAGAVLFLVSDGLLGVREFLLDDGSDGEGPTDVAPVARLAPVDPVDPVDRSARARRLLDVGVMVTYTAAQGLIAAGIADVVHADRVGTAHVDQAAGTAST